SQAPEDQAGVLAAEGEVGRHRDLDLLRARLVGDVVEVQLRVGVQVVAGGGQDARVQRLYRGDRLDAAGRAQRMPRHGLRAAHGRDGAVALPHRLEGEGLVEVVRLGAGA